MTKITFIEFEDPKFAWVYKKIEIRVLQAYRESGDSILK